MAPHESQLVTNWRIRRPYGNLCYQHYDYKFRNVEIEALGPHSTALEIRIAKGMHVRGRSVACIPYISSLNHKQTTYWDRQQEKKKVVY